MKKKINKKITTNKSWQDKFCGFIEKYEVLIFILIGVALLRLPSLIEPNRYADEDIYLTLGQGLRKGLVFYRDIHDNKPPLLYLLASVTGSVMWFRFVLLIWNLVNVVLVWKIAKKMLSNAKAIGVATFLFAVLSTIPLTEGNIANGEVFMIMPVTAAVLLLLYEKEKWKKIWWLKFLLAGILFSIGFLFKVPVVFDFIGVMIWLFIYEANNLKQLVRVVIDKRAWLLIIGFLAPIVLSILYYFSVNAGAEYIKAALGQNVSYVSSWEGEAKPFYESGMVQRLMIGGVWVLGILLSRKKLGREMGLVSLWLVMALFGANLSGRPYPHYLIQVVPPLALLIGVMIEKKEPYKRVIGLGLIFTVVLAIFRYQFWFYPSLPYYQNYFEYVTGQKNKEEFDRFFGNGVIRNNKVAEYIRMRTDEGEPIYVWGTEPAIYAVSNRLPVSKYTVAYHVKDFDGWVETMRQIEEERPKYIVIMDYEQEFKELNSYVTAKYTEVLTVEDARVYRRL